MFALVLFLLIYLSPHRVPLVHPRPGGTAGALASAVARPPRPRRRLEEGQIDSSRGDIKIITASSSNTPKGANLPLQNGMVAQTSSAKPWSLSLINSPEWRPQANASLMQLHQQAQDTSQLTFHVLILTVGRASIFRLLDSLEYQLSSRDYLTVAIHAVDKENSTASVLPPAGAVVPRRNAVGPEAVTARLQRGFKCSYFIQRIKLRPRQHYHQIRQMMKGIPGDFVIHSDDDNYYLPDAFLQIREHAVDRNTLYVFRLGNCSSSIPYTWRLKHLRIANVDTGNGVIPGWLNDKANWALLYFGDYHYYRNIHKFSINAPVFVDSIIGVYTGSGNQSC